MHVKTGLFALLVGTALSTAAFAQWDNPMDERTGGGFSNQGRSQTQGGDRYDPSTGGRRYRGDDGRWYYERSRDRWRDDDRYYRYRYDPYDRDRHYGDRYYRYDR